MRPTRSPPSPSPGPTPRAPAFLRRPGRIFGAAWLTFIVVASLSAPLWVPYEVDQQDTANRLALPSAEHWLGTDPLGRDLLSRIFTAGTLPLVSSALMLVVAFGIGVPLALLPPSAAGGPSGSSAGSPRCSSRCRC